MTANHLKTHKTIQETSALVRSKIVSNHPTYTDDLLKFIRGPSSLGHISTEDAEVDRVFEILIQSAINDKDWSGSKQVWERIKHCK